MAFEYTVRQCAEKLGVSEQRVYQLINEGLLPAEKTAGRYFVEEAAVDERVKKKPPAGRPKKAKPRRTVAYTLMNRTHEVLDFEYDEDAGEFSAVTAVHDLSRAPLGLTSPRGSKVSTRALTEWWAHRCVPVSRAGMADKLAQLGISNPSRIAFKCLGLSLSDQYWLRSADENIEWGSINFFDNEFDELVDAGWLSGVGLKSPDNTSEGQLPKRWIRRDGKPLLVKGASARGQEPYNELAATTLFGRVLDPTEYVPYRVEELPSGEKASSCPNFLNDEEEYIPAVFVMRVASAGGERSDFRHYLECCRRLGIPDAELQMSKMIVCDDIVGNTDRHWRNFGVVRNVETLECRIAPLFDTGASLWCHLSDDALAAGSTEFSTKPFHVDPNRQLRLVEDYSWLDLGALDGFPEEVAGILAANPALERRAPFVAEAVGKRIERIKVIV